MTETVSTPAERAALIGKLVGNSLELPSVPAIAVRIIAAANDPDASAASIASVIAPDLAMCGRILSVCNSALYSSGGNRVSNITMATARIGITEVKNLVIAASMKSLYKRFESLERGLWERSMAIAVATQVCARELAPDFKEQSFLAGQMHDVGKVVMINGARERYRPLATLSNDTICDAELKEFGFTHTDIGALLAERWNLDPSLSATCLYHHELDELQTMAPTYAPLVACVTIANEIADQVLSDDPPADPSADGMQALEMLSADAKQMRNLRDRFVAAYDPSMWDL